MGPFCRVYLCKHCSSPNHENQLASFVASARPSATPGNLTSLRLMSPDQTFMTPPAVYDPLISPYQP